MQRIILFCYTNISYAPVVFPHILTPYLRRESTLAKYTITSGADLVIWEEKLSLIEIIKLKIK